MGALAHALVLSLACAAGACLLQRPRPEPPTDAPTRETRRVVRPDGSTKEFELLVGPDGRGERDGLEREFHADGRLAAERSFARDVPTGVWRTWYPDGTLRSEVDFGPPASRDVRTSRHWHPGGELAAVGTTRTGVRDGEWAAWSPEGVMLSAGAYREGRRDGPWKLYDATGRLRAQGAFAQGARVGAWTLWDESGEPHVRSPDGWSVDELTPTELFHTRG